LNDVSSLETTAVTTTTIDVINVGEKFEKKTLKPFLSK